MKYQSDLNHILQVVSEESGIPEEVITNPKIKTRPVAHARHLAIYLACTRTWRSKEDIATKFNYADHAAVYHGLKKIAGFLVDGGEEAKQQFKIISKRLESK